MKATRKRLHDLESSLGARDEQFLSVEFYNLSPDGEEIRIRDPHLTADDRPAKRALRVVLVDTDGDGRPGPRALAWEKRRRLAEERTGPPGAASNE
jgi:hypothetical protein